MADEEYLQLLADGTVKQRNPFTGTRVWTVAGRGNRPLQVPTTDPHPVDPGATGAHCAFCERRYLETTPEKGRLVRDPEWRYLDAAGAGELFDTVAEFRRVPNLFEILTWDYWRLNTGQQLAPDVAARKAAYLADSAGRAHVLSLVRTKLRASGVPTETVDAASEEALLTQASGFFGGGHDVVVARRHLVDGAADDTQLAGAGTLTVDEHRHYVEFTVDAMARLYRYNPQARYVAAFQNWLKPAGASFDHLHKQLVAIDEWGSSTEETVARLRQEPNLFVDVLAMARRQGLVIAANEHAVAWAGVGHRYPTVEVWATSPDGAPHEHSADEIRAMSDLLHAVHAATGVDVPSNEEWHHSPPDCDIAMPWRVNLKWRVSTLAGFEGATKIYLNTLSPWAVRDRLLPRLRGLRDEGRIAPVAIGDECDVEPVFSP